MLFRSIVFVFALVGFCRVNAAYPDRPIRLIAPFAPGGNIDITARTVSPGLTEQLGQPVVVENRGGAGGRIGTELVAKSLPDGYTLLLGSSGSLTVNPSFSTTTSYDPIKDFSPTSLVSIVPLVLVVHPSMPVKTAREFIDLAKKKPNSVMMASAGSGSNTHLTGELFQITVGIKLTHVPYKGSGPALVDLLGGQTHCIFDQVSTSASYVNMGKLRALAVASNKRSQSLSSIPTMEQAGVKGFEAATYTGIFLPAGTSKEIVNRIYSALLRVLELPSTRDAFNRLGAEVVSSTPEELSSKLSQDLMKWRKVQLQTGIRLN
jgi:tripartite-type tricarboxylate transporter receptor subunit TctC